MAFSDATIRFHSTMTAACSQFEINTEAAVQMDLSGPSRYTYLKLDADQTQTINELAKKVGTKHERGSTRNGFMVYNVTFFPVQAKPVDSSCEANLEEKKIFGQIFKIATASIATQMKWSVNPSDVNKIVLQKAVDFHFMEAKRACILRVELSQSAVDRLGMDRDSRFREYSSD